MNNREENIRYCTDMLPKVSRTFAPTIRMLPRPLYVPVTVAYLLCRIADTVEDDQHLEREDKQRLLEIYASIFPTGDETAFDEFTAGILSIPDHSSDVGLVKNLDRVLDVYRSFSPEVRYQIGRWVVEMSLGMRKYAQTLERRKFQFLKSMKDLDEYMYYVAGTVGRLLTALFQHFSHKITPAVAQRMDQVSESFGKGLQMVNIIRDMAGDLRRGQSYIPDEILQKYELTRRTIFHASNRDKAEQLFNELIQTAVDHLDNALKYVVTIPKEETRTRLFCLLPMFWALRTLEVIQKNTLALLEADKVKISRRTIRIEFLKSLILAFSNRLTIRHYNKIKLRMAYGYADS